MDQLLPFEQQPPIIIELRLGHVGIGFAGRIITRNRALGLGQDVNLITENRRHILSTQKPGLPQGSCGLEFSR